MRENYTLTRLFISSPLTQGAAIALSKEQAHYLGTVLRKSTGDSLRVFNGESGEWRAEIIELSRKGGKISLTEQFRAPKSAPDIWLCFAPVRKHRTAFIIEKGTGLGRANFIRSSQSAPNSRASIPIKRAFKPLKRPSRRNGLMSPKFTRSPVCMMY